MNELALEVVGQIWTFIQEHWIEGLWVGTLTVVGYVVGKYRSRRKWAKREFLERVNVSINTFEDGLLKIRTFFEDDIENVLLNNQTAIDMVLEGIHQTRIDKPFIPLPENESWHILNAVLNAVSERFGVDLLASDMGIPAKKENYIFGLTCEKDDDVRLRKVRVMLIRENLLTKIAQGEIEKPRYEKPHHHVRWKTLQTMARLYQAESKSSQGLKNLMRIEVVLPL